jgi:hypothetical protein
MADDKSRSLGFLYKWMIRKNESISCFYLVAANAFVNLASSVGYGCVPRSFNFSATPANKRVFSRSRRASNQCAPVAPPKACSSPSLHCPRVRQAMDARISNERMNVITTLDKDAYSTEGYRLSH